MWQPMVNFEDEFRGKRVVITGAAGVYGRALSRAFRAAEANLLLTDFRDAELSTLGSDLDSEYVVADLTTDAGLRELCGAMAYADRAPDVIVNNAAVYPRTPFQSTAPREVRRILDLNVVAAYEIARQACTQMIEDHVAGCVVNVSSGAAVRPSRTGSIYCASKAALEALTRSLCLEVAPYGIRVNAVQPGFAPGSAVSHLTDDYVEKMIESIPLGRPTQPADLAGAVMWLCSSAASYVTGSTISVDGGQTAGVGTSHGS